MSKEILFAPKGALNIPRECQNPKCKTIFYTRQARIRRQYGRYCCRSCATYPLNQFRASISSQVPADIRAKAVKAVARALRKGTLKKEPCHRCGSTINVQRHHEDYSEMLGRTWLCQPCHSVYHFVVVPQTLQMKKSYL